VAVAPCAAEAEPLAAAAGAVAPLDLLVSGNDGADTLGGGHHGCDEDPTGGGKPDGVFNGVGPVGVDAQITGCALCAPAGAPAPALQDNLIGALRSSSNSSIQLSSSEEAIML